MMSYWKFSKLQYLKKLPGIFYSRTDKTRGYCVSTDPLRKHTGLRIWASRAARQIVSIHRPKFKHAYHDVFP